MTYFHLRTDLLKLYKRNYIRWLRFYIAEAALAMTGLILAIANWDKTFDDRYTPDGLKMSNDGWLQIVVMCTTAGAIFCLIWKAHCASIWQKYQDPYQFSLSFLKHTTCQYGINTAMPSRFETKYKHDRYKTIIKNPEFWFELAILLILPYPGILNVLPMTFTT